MSIRLHDPSHFMHFLGATLLAIGVACTTQPGEPGAGQDGPVFSTWARSYGGAFDDEANAIEQTFDGGFIMAGRAAYSNPNEKYMWVVKQDANGQIDWANTYGDLAADRLELSLVWAVTPTSDGGVAAVGRHEGQDGFRVVKLSRDGGVQWRRDYDPAPRGDSVEGDAGEDRIFQIHQTPEGNYFLVGSNRAEVFAEGGNSGTVTTDTDALVVKLDNAGETIWRRVYGENGESSVGEAVDHAPAGGAVVAGLEGRDLLVLRLLSDGSVLWEHTDSFRGALVVSDVSMTDDDLDGEKDDGVVVAGGADTDLLQVGADSDVLVVKVTGDGEGDWFSGFDLGDSFDRANCVEQVTFEDNNGVRRGFYVVAGQSNLKDGGRDRAAVLALDLQGDELARSIHDSPQDERGLGIHWIDPRTSGEETRYVMSGLGVDPEAASDGVKGFSRGLDANLNPVWTTFFDLPAPLEMTDDVSVGASSEGGFVWGGGDPLGWAMKVGGDGQVAWRRIDDAEAETSSDGVVTCAYAIQQTDDSGDGQRNGGYIVVGETRLSGAGGSDVWVVKLDGGGRVVWQKAFGGEGDEAGYAVQQTMDRGFIVAGSSSSFNPNGSSADMWLIKLMGNGALDWEKRYSLAGENAARAVLQTSDGGYVMVGKWSGSRAGAMRLSGKGDIVWQIRLDTPGAGDASAVVETPDGGFVVGGTADVAGRSLDAWLCKLNGDGQIQWSQVFGFANRENNVRLQATGDGGLVVSASTRSVGGGLGCDAGDSAACTNFWLLKLGPAVDGLPGLVDWERVYGGGLWDSPRAIGLLGEGGFVVAGGTESITASRDAWVLKLGVDGTIDPSCVALLAGGDRPAEGMTLEAAGVESSAAAMSHPLSGPGAMWRIADTVAIPTNVFDATVVTESCSGVSPFAIEGEDPAGRDLPTDAGDARDDMAPIADAGYFRVVSEGEMVTLDGTGSVSPTTLGLVYRWSLDGGVPAGVTAALTNADTATPGFVVTDMAVCLTAVRVTLTVFDGDPTAPETLSDTDTVDIQVVALRAMADAGPDQEVVEGTTVSLDGSVSSDPDGDALTFEWEQIGGPAVVLDDAAAIGPLFVAPQVGPGGATVTLKLTVRDLDHCGAILNPSTDEVAIVVTNLAVGGGAPAPPPPPPPPPCGEIVLEDEAFGVADWAITELVVNGGATQSFAQAIGGGNPGDYGGMTFEVPMGSDIAVGYVYLGGSYDPSVEGAIAGIDYSEDRILVDAGVSAQIGSGFLIEQGGNTFVAGLPDVPAGFVWTTENLVNLGAGDFVWIAGDNAAAVPDFSAGGGEIMFGFMRSSTGEDFIGHGIDNWSVTIHQACP